jgi:hypothetical protein
MSEKIRPQHLERKAILYVRQSAAAAATGGLSAHGALIGADALGERTPGEFASEYAATAYSLQPKPAED